MESFMKLFTACEQAEFEQLLHLDALLTDFQKDS
jgi:hypothetical protein